ncbi:hypothetical protein C8Q76DRAFT_800382 [Earliella scabrosa]|nr:hypothetical protein C8Q76DRAFT_800382 [Earliella scabrosa]
MANTMAMQDQAMSQTNRNEGLAAEGDGGDTRAERDGFVADVTHGILEVSTEVLQVVPIAGLQEAARLIAKIWEAVQAVKHNRRECALLAERSDALLKWAREAFAKAGQDVAAELEDEIADFVRSLRRIYEVIDKLRAKSFLKHYIRRNEIAQDLQGCSKRLNDVRWTLVASIQLADFEKNVAAKRQNEELAAGLRAAQRQNEELAATLRTVQRQLEQVSEGMLAAQRQIAHLSAATAAAERKRELDTAAILGAIGGARANAVTIADNVKTEL